MAVRAVAAAGLPDVGVLRGAIDTLAGDVAGNIAHAMERGKTKWPEPVRAAWMRSGEQLVADMHQLAAQHPDLVRVEQAGTSVEGRPILLLRVTAPVKDTAAALAKPKVLHVGGMHAREIGNPELVMRHIEDLVRGYGTDAEATHVLDTTEVLAIPLVNPDGRHIVEGGLDAIARRDAEGAKAVWHRGNAAQPASVDINRNFPHAWGNEASSADPGSLHYRGPSAGSEPEVQAVMRTVRQERPALYSDWHSQGELNLYPYGNTKVPAPRDTELRGLAEQLALRNGHTPESSSTFTTDSGTSKDWVHAETGAPAFTIETGKVYAFTDADFADARTRNEPVMRYMERIASEPWKLGMAPSVAGVSLLGGKVGGRAMVAPGHDVAAGAELITDVHATPGSGVPLAVAADGSISGSVDLSKVDGRSLAYVRARDAGGDWGPLSAAWTS